LQTTEKKTILEVKNLSFAYVNDLVLQDINLEVQERDFLALIGPNGGGKSTLMKLILGIHEIQSGSIKIFGKNAGKQASYIGYVPQNTNVNINFPIKVIEIVMMGLAKKSSFSFGYSKKEVAHAMSMLKQVGIENYAHTKIGSLSGGQRQRAMIARALYTKPKILLLDEPTASIDASGQKQIYDLLKELNKSVTIIVISHDLSVILEYANKVAHINKKLFFHDLGSLKNELNPSQSHMCEVELLEMLSRHR
jgi:zinc transport system ATP-binding protein